MPDRCGGKVAHVDRNTDRALARFQERPNGVERRNLHDENHDRRGQDRRERRLFEHAGEVLRRNRERK